MYKLPAEYIYFSLLDVVCALGFVSGQGFLDILVVGKKVCVFQYVIFLCHSKEKHFVSQQTVGSKMKNY